MDRPLNDFEALLFLILKVGMTITGGILFVRYTIRYSERFWRRVLKPDDKAQQSSEE